MTPSPRTTFVAIALGACLLVGAAACGLDDGGHPASADTQPAAAGGVSVTDATIDWPANPKVAAVRMVVHNDAGADDTLESVSSPVAAQVSIHRTETDDAGRSAMVEQGPLPIAARSTVTFEPGGLHVMLTGITEDLQVGDRVPLTLTFAKAGDVHATADVIEPGSAGEGSGGDHDH
jgi:copper(I)-binding protein